MPKSLAEIERLKINAQNQNLLVASHLKQLPKAEYKKAESINQISVDVFQPKGEIDYSRFNKSEQK